MLTHPAYATHADLHAAEIAELIAPQGRLGCIGDRGFDIMFFKSKAVSIHPELMFTRSVYSTADIGEQGKIMNAVAVLVDEGRLARR